MNYNADNDMEIQYLSNTIVLLNKLINTENSRLSGRRKELISTRKDMWENSVHFTDDFDKLTELSQQLQNVQSRTIDHNATLKTIANYSKMLESPYFARIDFKEDGYADIENIYIGKSNLKDPDTGRIVVYDWRAPISSMFYRFEPGKAIFKAPFGEISGDVTLKRQYKIIKSRLQYFFDCSVQINDDILQEVLSRNASSKMRNIIETIQREQDIIIRDSDSDLLIVQGVAGSGKTSIALHRIAYLLYEGVSSGLEANNIIILSPNDAFNDYISQVLPELGEENVEISTMESIIRVILEKSINENKFTTFKGRTEQLEACISGTEDMDGNTVSSWVQFKGSKIFLEIIERFLKFYQRRLVKFEDVFYHGNLIINSSELKMVFLNDKTNTPLAKRLERIENRIMDKIEGHRKKLLKSFEHIVQKSDGHEFEIKAFSRLLLLKDSQKFSKRLESFLKLDEFIIYRELFKDPERFLKISEGLPFIFRLIYAIAVKSS